MTYAPPPEAQYDPTTSTSGKDCVAATAALLVNRATVGRIATDHAAIRKASGAPSTRGLYLWEAAFAVDKLFGVKLMPLLLMSRNSMRDTVAGGAACGVTINCAVTRYTARRTNYYTGLHEVSAVRYQWWPGGDTCACEKALRTAHAEYLVEDPGTTGAGYLWWSADLLYRAGESVTGGAGINLLVAPDTEGVTRIGVGGPLYTKPFRSSPTKGKITPGVRYTVTSTFSGGGWPRADGGTSYGWHRVPGDLYAPGKALR